MSRARRVLGLAFPRPGPHSGCWARLSSLQGGPVRPCWVRGTVAWVPPAQVAGLEPGACPLGPAPGPGFLLCPFHPGSHLG